MSRIGKRPIVIPKGVEVKIEKERVTIKGPKGLLSFDVPPLVEATCKEGKLLVSRKEESRHHRSCQGVVQSVLQNMVQGVFEGFNKELEIQGVGYRAEVKGKDLQLYLGFSHPVLFPIPEGIQIKVANQTKVSIHGFDKVLVGQVAATLRQLKPPEPYQGKGIRYAGEVVKRKVGKAAAGATAT